MKAPLVAPGVEVKEFYVFAPKTAFEGRYQTTIKIVSDLDSKIFETVQLIVNIPSPIIICYQTTPIITTTTKTAINYVIRGPTMQFPIPDYTYSPFGCTKPTKIFYSLKNDGGGVLPKFIVFFSDKNIV